jgi:hypothetical protein
VTPWLLLAVLGVAIVAAMRRAWNDPWRLGTLGAALTYLAGVLTAMLIIG